MKTLVIGGAGYIGSHCSKALVPAGHEVVVLDNLSTGHADLCSWGKLVKGSVNDQEVVNQLFAAHAFSAVFHFAAKSLVVESARKPALPKIGKS